MLCPYPKASELLGPGQRFPDKVNQGISKTEE